MLKYTLRRILWIFPVIIAITAVVFLLMKLVPGSPWSGSGERALSNVEMDDVTRAALNERYGLDKPLWRQYTTYLIGDTNRQGQFICGMVCGNLGVSFRLRGQPVRDILFGVTEERPWYTSRIFYSVRLALLGFAIALLVSIPLGTLAALRPRSRIDRSVRLLSVLSLSVPNFTIGLLLIILLGSKLGLIAILPKSWADAPFKTWLVPALILALTTLGAMIRLTRTSLLDVIQQDYVRTARAKGLRRHTIVVRHMLRNALIPIATFSAPALIELMTASFIVESMFGFPGIGREFIVAVVNRDMPVVIALAVLYGAAIALVNLAIDLLYGVLDPRIRIQQHQE